MRYDLNKLEFDKVKDLLRRYIKTVYGIKELEKVVPVCDADFIKSEFKLVKEATNFLSVEGNPLDSSLFENEEIEILLKRSKVESSILKGDELLKIKQFLLTLLAIKSKVKGKFDNLEAILSNLVIPKDLIELISNVVDESGYVKDSASEKLHSIREKIKSTRKHIVHKIKEVMNRPNVSKVLQDRDIHFKNERYTLAVRGDKIQAIEGVLIDVSSTGFTAFVEPKEVVTLNNELVMLKKEEKKEEERILREVTKKVGFHAKGLLENLRIVGKLDFIFARASFMIDFGASIPGVGMEKRLHLIKARHPILLDIKGVDNTVPIDVYLDGDKRTLVITGPNMGGKTVALKTIGLLSLMALSGIPVTASGDSYFYCFDGIYADIGDEQSIEGSLSTFSAHMKNIKRILDESTEKSLVLIDELGTGTDPNEGSALSVAIVEELNRKGSINVITTHHNSLKLLALSTDGMENASCEFDPETLEPTYRLIVGLPGTSNAIQIARKLGVPERILDRASYILGNREVEDSIIEGAKYFEKAKKMYEEAVKMKKMVEEELVKAKEKANEIIAEAVSKSQKLIDEIEKITNQSKYEKPRHPIVLNAKKVLKDFIKSSLKEEKIEKGDTVTVRGLGIRGVVVNVEEKHVKVDTGRIVLTVPLESVVLFSKGTGERVDENREIKVTLTRERKTFFPEIDVRGYRVDEALSEVERFLNDAIILGFSEVRIVHGKGEGILKRAIHEYIGNFPFVKSFRIADENEGSSGVTIVSLDV